MFLIISPVFRLGTYTEGKNGVNLTQKVESLAELKFDPGFRVIGKYLSQIDSQYRVHFYSTF